MQTQDTVLVPLRAKKGSVRAHAIIDTADAAFANQWRWHLNSGGYAARGQRIGPRHLGYVRFSLLHRELLGLDFGDVLEVDHINRNKLDNRRANLRIVTRNQQMQNQPSHLGASSEHRGVARHKASERWQAYLNVNGKRINLGRFTTETEAAEAARAARARLMPYAVD